MFPFYFLSAPVAHTVSVPVKPSGFAEYIVIVFPFLLAYAILMTYLYFGEKSQHEYWRESWNESYNNEGVLQDTIDARQKEIDDLAERLNIANKPCDSQRHTIASLREQVEALESERTEFAERINLARMALSGELERTEEEA